MVQIYHEKSTETSRDFFPPAYRGRRSHKVWIYMIVCNGGGDWEREGERGRGKESEVIVSRKV